MNTTGVAGSSFWVLYFKALSQFIITSKENTQGEGGGGGGGGKQLPIHFLK